MDAKIIAWLCGGMLALAGCAEEATLKKGCWELSLDQKSGGIDIRKDSLWVFDDLYAAYKLSDSTITTLDYEDCAVSVKEIADAFGKGFKYEISYTDEMLPALVQAFYVYPDKDYILTEYLVVAFLPSFLQQHSYPFP